MSTIEHKHNVKVIDVGNDAVTLERDEGAVSVRVTFNNPEGEDNHVILDDEAQLTLLRFLVEGLP